MLHRKHVDAKGNWVSYRPDIKISTAPSAMAVW